MDALDGQLRAPLPVPDAVDAPHPALGIGRFRGERTHLVEIEDHVARHPVQGDAVAAAGSLRRIDWLYGNGPSALFAGAFALRDRCGDPVTAQTPGTVD